MKKYSKILLAVLLFAMMVSLVACGGNSDNTSGTDLPPADDTPPASDTDIDSGSFTTANPGYLTMATNAQFPPYEFYEGSDIVGIDAEIAAAIAEKLGLELMIEDMEFDSITTAVNTGKADIGLAGMTVTEERLEEVNFTESYATGVQVVIVAEGGPIASVDDLFDVGGFTIGVQRNTTGDMYTTWDLEDEGLATIDRYSKGADAVMALKTGKVDCVVIDNEPAKAFVAENEGLMILETEYAVEDYAGAMSKSNTALFEAVNAALKELIADGTIKAIIEKYISA